MTSAADLLALQDIDLKRDARRALLADIEARLGETDAIIDAREGVEATAGALASLQRKQRELEAQQADLDAKITPLETKLYGGSVRNPKELTDLQKELDSFKTRRSALDDQGLTLMENIEAASREVSAANEELTAAEAEWEADQEHLKLDKSKAERETAALDEERGRWAATMDAHTLGLYEKLRTQRQGRAVARIERTNCQGCRLTLPTHIIQRVRAGHNLIQCPSCERILVFA